MRPFRSDIRKTGRGGGIHVCRLRHFIAADDNTPLLTKPVLGANLDAVFHFLDYITPTIPNYDYDDFTESPYYAILTAMIRELPYDLTELGLPEIPIFGITRYERTLPSAKPHQHHGIVEISCCIRGAETFECNGESYPFRPGCITIAKPHDRHRFSGRTKNASKYWMFLSLTFDDTWLGLSSKDASCLIRQIKRLPHLLYDKSGDFRRYFTSALQFVQNPCQKSTESRIRLNHLVQGLILALLSASQTEQHASSLKRIEAIIDNIRAHPERDYPLDILIAQCHLSPSNLLRKFKSITGFPPHAFLLNCKIDAAKKMLRHNAKISKVAQTLGFATARHFISQFKSHTGKTPTQYRESLLNLNESESRN